MKWLYAWMYLCFGLVFALTAMGQTADPTTVTADEVNAVARQMYCMECENIPLDVCGTQACVQWREEIRLQLAEGKTANEILEYFRIYHGDRALAIPRSPWQRFLSLWLPIIGIISIVALGINLLRQASHPTPRHNAPIPPQVENPVSSLTYQQRLDQDLNNL
ncbi:MAG: cytochrome c-type biogenesis protein [Phototrophicaceae bacterium]